ncbi:MULTISPECIES: aminomethyl-transferring glycine dehydrogenase subunit GcvPA [unclassified Haladaptatus]|uniref:aminomethyl-transferring glycine dehydrogenase subunit GcvPA n=1 Tax=unclassified Haladaptatus TaxID=2622732 RepID=UPI0023E7E29D|nr:MULTISPECIES: aminomethyl-transferring glycine dehydrogenase subunit GcvPA [unclassified Haladaptatus]
MSDSATPGSPFAPHTPDETQAMLDVLGVASEEDLFDIPDDVAFDGTFGIPQRSEQSVRARADKMLNRNANLTEFLGRGHYSHYIPSLVDNLSIRSEFLTSYTQYQPEVAQGFLQVLFEYQSMLAELTGLEIANCSMYDAATALGEAATLANRLRKTSGHRVLVPKAISVGRRDVLENYVDGSEMVVESYAMDDGNADLDVLTDLVDDDVVMIYAENPTVRGTIEEGLAKLGKLAHDNDAIFTLGSDPVALSLLEKPSDVGADVVVGDASTLGIPTSFGMGLGIFACREDFLRQVPGRLVGISEDSAGMRAYTLTLQTREQHIRRERATSNICSNQAWVALRAAMHIAMLGPDGLVDLARDCVTRPEELAERLDDISGIQAPVHDRYHFREFVAHTDQPAKAIVSDLAGKGFAVHRVGEHEVQVCVTETNAIAVDEFVAAFEEVA